MIKLLRNVLSIFVVFTLESAVLFATAGNGQDDKQNGAQTEKTNIVVILIDDMGWTDVGYMANEYAKKNYYETPNIDRLAAAGMKFTNAYANAANCAPTRACLLSGQYTPRHGVFNVGLGERGKAKDRRVKSATNQMELDLDKITIAEALGDEYATAAIGKWHLVTKQNHETHSAKNQGFNFAIDREEINFKGHFNKETGEYLTDRLTDEAIGFIERNNDKPFFLYLAHHAIHTPIQAKENLIEKYASITGEGCHSHAKYAAMIESVDSSVYRVQQKLKELGIEENTIIWFVSDNGGHGAFTCQDPLRGGKGMYYEGGIREPMFVYWPETIKPGTTCDVPVITTDIYPTILDIANIARPANYTLDGESILPLFKDQSGTQKLKRDKIFWHFPCYLSGVSKFNKGESRDPLFRTRPVSVIRKGDYKLMMFHEEWALDGGYEKRFTNNSIELYNLANDIGEIKNLATIEKDLAETMLKELLEWQKQTNAPLAEKPNSEYNSGK